MTLDRFTNEFSKLAFKRYPEWESIAVPIKYRNSDEHYLSITIESPDPSRENLEIITVDDEVTVDFSFYHIHMSSVEKALDYVEALLTESLVVMKKESEYGESCSYMETMAFLETDENEPKEFKAVRSWKGTFDRG